MTQEISPVAPHWLTFTVRGNPETLRQRLGGDAYSSAVPSTAFGCDGYWMHESGAKLHHHFRDNRVVLDAPGTTCETWADHWLQAASRNTGRITRLDLARDIGPAELARKRMLAMRSAWFRKTVDTKIRTFEETRSYNGADGFTWYFGARQSPLRLRVYDRRGPLRLEFQWRPDDRDQLLADILARDLNGCWASFTSKLIFSFKWYRDLMGSSSPLLWQTKHQETEWEQAATQLREQWGFTLWALDQLSVDVRGLMRDPADLPRATRARLWRWAGNAGQRGKRLQDSLRQL